MTILPNDTVPGDWGPDNLQKWSAGALLQLVGYNDPLAPLEAKSLHVIGLLVQTYNAASHLLYVGGQGPCANYYLHAYLLACSAIELLARCKDGDQDLTVGTNPALRRGFGYITQLPIVTNQEQYDGDKLVALRNLASLRPQSWHVAQPRPVA
jgi:hypothetical protein